MAIGTHVVRLHFTAVDSAGNRIDKNTVSIRGMMQSTSTEHRVQPDNSIPNSASWPTVKAYLEAEAGDNYILAYMDQNTIVTYSATDINGA